MSFEAIREREKLAYINDSWKERTSLEVVKTLDAFLDFTTVLDAGCGSGVYVRAFRKIGKRVLGVDGNPDASSEDLVDLSSPWNPPYPFDLVFSIEVAEHIPPEGARAFVRNLIRSSGKWIVITAHPKEGNPSEYRKVAHLNEQDPSYWIDLFEKEGASFSRDRTAELRSRYLTCPKIPPWFHQTLLLFSLCADSS